MEHNGGTGSTTALYYGIPSEAQGSNTGPDLAIRGFFVIFFGPVTQFPTIN